MLRGIQLLTIHSTGPEFIEITMILFSDGWWFTNPILNIINPGYSSPCTGHSIRTRHPSPVSHVMMSHGWISTPETAHGNSNASLFWFNQARKKKGTKPPNHCFSMYIYIYHYYIFSCVCGCVCIYIYTVYIYIYILYIYILCIYIYTLYIRFYFDQLYNDRPHTLQGQSNGQTAPEWCSCWALLAWEWNYPQFPSGSNTFGDISEMLEKSDVILGY